MISFPAFIRIADNELTPSGVFLSGLRRADHATLADWVAASRYPQSDHVLRDIQRVIELARSQDIDPEKPLVQQLRLSD
jgi:hypothetical protein